MRFKIDAELGRGSSGVVSRAFDSALGRHVALKQLLNLDSETLLGLKSEYRIRHQISHPGLVQIYELGAEDTNWWISMEYVEGVHLVDYVRQTLEPGQPLTSEALQRCRDTFEQLATAVNTLHSHGCHHRDLKPANILVTESGRLVVLDFGLAVRAELRQLQRPSFSGTLMYMAPEQMMGKPATPESDWYAVGALLSECLSGEPAFKGTAPEIAAAKYRGDIPDHPEADSTLAGLVHKLLSKDPQNRNPGALLEEHQARPNRRSHKLIARDTELGALNLQLHAVKQGRRRIVHLTAKSGFGKTSLMQVFKDQNPEVLFLMSRCHLRETVPFNGFDGAIDTIVRDKLFPNDEDLANDLATASILFPNLGGEAVQPNLEQPPAAQRRLALLALARLFRAIERPIILWIDDAHWGDRDSGMALRELLDSGLMPPVLLVFAYQSELVDSNGMIETLKEAEVEEDLTLVLDALDEPQARSLIAAEAEQLPEPLTNKVLDLAQGSPLLLRDYAQYLASHPIDSTDNLFDELISNRLSTAGPGSDELISLIAVGGHSLNTQELLNTDAHSDDLTTLYRMQDLQMLTATSANRFELSDSSTRVAILNRLNQAQRQNLHTFVAKRIERREQPDNLALLEHWQAAGNKTKAASSALLGAQEAHDKLAFDLEADLYGKAFELRAKGDTDWSLLVSQAKAFANSNRGARAGETFNAAIAAAERQGNFDTLGLRAEASRQLLCAGAVDTGLETLKNMLSAARLSWPRTVIHAVSEIALSRVADAVHTATGISFVTGPVTKDRVDACWAATMGLNSFDAVRSATFQAKHTQLAKKLGDPVRNVRALAAEAMFRTAEGGTLAITRSEQELAEAKRLADQSGDAYAKAFVELSAGVAAYFSCQWPLAVSRLGAALESFEQLNGVAWEKSNCRLWRISALYWSGDLNGLLAEQEATQHRAMIEENVNLRLAANAGHGNFTRILRGDIEAALEECSTSIDPFRGDGFRSPFYAELVSRMQIDLYQNQAGTAFHRFDQLQTTLRRSGLLRLGLFGIEANLLCANAAITLQKQHRGHARSKHALVQAIRRLQKSPLPIAAPLAKALLAINAEQPNESSLRQFADEMEALNFKLLAWATRNAINEENNEPELARGTRYNNLAATLMPGQQLANLHQ